MYKVNFSKEAENFYFECNDAEAKKIDKAIEYLNINPYKHPNIKRLTGKLTGYSRYRAGNMRIVYSIHEKEKVIFIYNIGHRGNIYS